MVSIQVQIFFFFFNDTATTEIYTLSLHDALPILRQGAPGDGWHERRRHLGDPQAHPRGEGACRRVGRPAVARDHRERARRDRRLQGRARRGREDPLRPVSLSRMNSTKIRVRYKDTDCMQIVYYGNYLTYFEVGRVEFLRAQGLPMSDVDRKVHLPVVEAVVR